MKEIIKKLEETCLTGKCLYDDNGRNILPVTCSDVFIEVLSFLKKLDEFPTFKPHIPCILVVVEKTLSVELPTVVNAIHEELDDWEAMQTCLVNIALVLCKLPDIHFPLKLKHDSASDKEFDQNHKLNPRLTNECLKIYERLMLRDQPEIANYQKFFVKRTCVSIIVLASSRLGKFSWTNDLMRNRCKGIMDSLKEITMCSSIGDLLSGNNIGKKHVLFTTGLLGNILDMLSRVFTKEKWNKNLPWKHSFIWCVTKVKYPHLGEHTTKIVPYLLLMVDDYVDENKLFGMSTLLYVIDNVSPSDLNLYNHGKVIYDALFGQLFTNKSNLYEVVLPCLQRILKVVEPNPDKVDGIQWTLWDKSLEKIIQNIEFSNHIQTRRVLLKYLPLFIDEMKINTGKHLNQLFKALQFVLQFPDTQGEVTRLYSLDILRHVIKICWVFIPRHQVMLLKTHIRLCLDLSSTCTASKTLKEKSIENLILLRVCCKVEFESILKEAIDTDIPECNGKDVQKMLLKVVNTDISNYNFVS